MRRISLLMLFLAVMLTLLTGCGKSHTGTQGNPVVIETSDTQDPPDQNDAPSDQMATNTQDEPSGTTGPEQTVMVDTHTEIVEVTNTAVDTADQQAKPQATHQEIKLPEIRFEKIIHNYGDMGPGTREESEFPFKNVGNGVLRISKIDAPCGCTVPKLDKKEYEPGQSGLISVRYHAQTEPGNVRKVVYLETNDPANEKVTLTLKATVVKRIAHEPERLKFFLGEEKDEVKEITLESLDGRPFSIKSFTSTANCITADFDPSVEATKFVLQAKVDGDKLKANLRGRVNIGLTHPECANVDIYFDVLPRYTVNPPMIIIFDAEPLKPVSRKVWVLSNYEKPVELDGIVAGDDAIKVLSQSEIRNGQALMLEITPPEVEGKINHNGEFSIRLKDGDKLPITYRIFYKQADDDDN